MQMLAVLWVDLLGLVYFQNCMVAADDVEVASLVLAVLALDMVLGVLEGDGMVLALDMEQGV